MTLEQFVSRYLLTDERTNADRDHKSLSKTHKIDTHSNHRLKLNCAMVTLVISPFLLSPLTLFESSYSKKKFIGIMFHEFWYCENGAIKNPYMIYSIMRPLTDHSAILVKNFPAVGVYLVNFGSRG